MKIRREEHMAGGNGHVIIKEILDAEQLNGKCGLYAQVTLEPGCSLGYHEHHGESETYYIIQGQGERQGERPPGKSRRYHFHTRQSWSWSCQYRKYRPCIYGADYQGLIACTKKQQKNF